jgi:hypothetical protein
MRQHDADGPPKSSGRGEHEPSEDRFEVGGTDDHRARCVVIAV